MRHTARRSRWLLILAVALALAAGAALPAAALAAAPPRIVYSTYLGGSDHDLGRAVATDPAGNAYVAGTTLSEDFPAATYLTRDDEEDVFVAKLDPKGSALSYSTVLGGSFSDSATSLAVDSQGNAYVGGETYSADFPEATNPPDPGGPGSFGSTRAFVAKLGPGGSLDWVTFLGSEGGGSSTVDVAVDSAGSVYAVMADGFFRETHLVKLDAAGAPHSFPDGFVAGCGTVTGSGFLTSVAVDPLGNVHVAGYTALAAFASKLTPSGAVVHATCLDGSSGDAALAVAADGTGATYVAGDTHSPDFPGAGPVATPRGAGDLFVTKLDPTGAIVYSTVLSGSLHEDLLGLAIDEAGAAHLLVATDSLDFPLVRPLPSSCEPDVEHPCPLLAKLDPTGAGLVYSTLLSRTLQSFWPETEPLAVDLMGNVYLTGTPATPDFPIVHALQPVPGGRFDAFVLKLAERGPRRHLHGRG